MCDGKKGRIENLLKLYFNDKLVTKYRIEQRRSKQNYHPRGVDYQSGSSINKKEKSVSSEIENFCSKKDESAQKASFLKLLIDDIEDSLETLSEEEYKLLKLTYENKNNLTDQNIANKLNISYWTVGRKREHLLEEMTELINIEYYISNAIADLSGFFRTLVNE